MCRTLRRQISFMHYKHKSLSFHLKSDKLQLWKVILLGSHSFPNRVVPPNDKKRNLRIQNSPIGQRHTFSCREMQQK